MAKIRRLSEVSARRGVSRNAPHWWNSMRTQESIDVLEQARVAWDALRGWRTMARRARDFTFGKQWNDLVPNPNYGGMNESKFITEEANIIRQGKTPLKNNMIRALVRAIMGQFLQNYNEPLAAASDRDDQELGETATILMQYNYTENEMRDLDWHFLLRLAIGGVCISKVGHGYRADKGKRDTWVDYINPNNAFWSATANDVRMWDINLIGEFADMEIEDVVASFATTEAEAEAIRDLYGRRDIYGAGYVAENLTSRRVDNNDFLLCHNPSLCRVIEVWRKESKPRYLVHDMASGEVWKCDRRQKSAIDKENAERISMAKGIGVDADDVALIEYEPIIDRFWKARWLTPWGDVLREMESPYEHGEHPYTISVYPNYDGEVHSFVEDVIDQQKYINRLITMHDFIVGASAKGVLMIPEDSIPDGMTAEDFAEEWVRYNGVIVYKARPGMPIPQQVSSNSTNVGVLEMTQLQMQLLSEISGISGSLQGKQAKSGTASSLYAQESQNSANNLVELLTTFNLFRERRDKKMLQCDLQFYKEKRFINLVGMERKGSAQLYEPNKIKDVSFDVRIVEGVDTPAYRQIANDMLMQFWQSGQLMLEDVLEVGAFPFADRLKRVMERRKQEAVKQQQAQQQMQQQSAVAQGALPNSVGAETEESEPTGDGIQQMIPKEIRDQAYGDAVTE